MKYIKNIKQETEYSCGASCVLSILNSLGIDSNESLIRKELQSNPKYGTSIEAIKNFFITRGFNTHIYEMNFYDLKEALLNNDFVILLLQYYETKKNNKNSWKDGHYCILTNIIDDNIFLHDPYRGYKICLKYDMLKELWHDINYGKVYKNIGVHIFL